MRTSSGTKRRRRRERRLLELCNTLSVRTAAVATLATGGFLVLQAVRIFFPA